jgi:hypothetical protein
MKLIPYDDSGLKADAQNRRPDLLCPKKWKSHLRQWVVPSRPTYEINKSDEFELIHPLPWVVLNFLGKAGLTPKSGTVVTVR